MHQALFEAWRAESSQDQLIHIQLFLFYGEWDSQDPSPRQLTFWTFILDDKETNT